MALGYRTAEGSLVSLKPLGVELFQDDGAPVLRLSGAETAALATGRAMRAAQAVFDLPVVDPRGRMHAGKRVEHAARLGHALQQKQFSAFQEESTKLIRLVYREVVARFKRGTDSKRRDAMLQEVGLEVRKRHPVVRNQYVLYDAASKMSGAELVDAAQKLAEMDEVMFATPNFVSQYRRSAAPLHARVGAAQWHLPLVQANAAWRITRGKRAITIAILDDGVDVAHPELAANIRRRPDPDEPRDLYGRDFFVPDDAPDHFDPRPKRFRRPFQQMDGNDIHGTPCAGVAVGCGPRGYGLAPSCRILPVKVFHADDLAEDARVADAIRYAAAFADVISCSWGGPQSPDVAYALRDAAEQGRGGKGTVIVCAAGNEHPRYPVGFPASNESCIAVGASTDTDTIADYSCRGPELCVVAPSSGGVRGIFTTDVSDAGRGFNVGQAAAGGADGLFTNDFGGTSSATPLVAGLCALLLSAKPSLTAQEVRESLIAGARKIGPASAYGPNGKSTIYGHGCIDAAASLAAIGAQAPRSRRRKRPAKVPTRRKPGARRKAAQRGRD